MSAVQLFPGWLPASECAELARWALTHPEQFVAGIQRTASGEIETVTFRRTTRMARGIEYPPLVYAVRQRIADLLGLHRYEPIKGHGRDGVVCVITGDGGDTYPHRDPGVGPDLDALRCNVVVQSPEVGGRLWVAGEPYDLREGDLHCYRVNVHEHRVETCYGRSRVAFLFGWGVPCNR